MRADITAYNDGFRDGARGVEDHAEEYRESLYWDRYRAGWEATATEVADADAEAEAEA